MKVFHPFSEISKGYLYIMFTLQIVFALIVWQFNTPELIPQPSDVIHKIYELITSRDFYENLFESLLLSVKAMLISIFVACLIGYASVIPFFRGIAHFLIKLRYLTLVGLVFTFTLLLHSGSAVKISFMMFGIIPFFVLSLLSVIDSIQQKEYDLCKTLGMNNWETLWELIIVGRLDQTIETIRANFAISWLMITMVETYSMSDGGIGVMLYKFNRFNQLDNIFALQFIIFGIGIMFDYLLAKTRELFFPYVKINKSK